MTSRDFSLIFQWLPIVIFFPLYRSITYAQVKLPPSTFIFSFDDGPNNNENTTNGLLDVLKKNNVRAIFALFGDRAQMYPHLVKRINAEGHLIINHGYSDKWVFKMKDKEFKENLIKGEQAINSVLGQDKRTFSNGNKFYRPHGGLFISRQEKICVEEGYKIIPGNIRVYDAAETEINKDKIVANLIKKVKKQGAGIILLHDSRDSVATMEKELKNNPHGPFNRSWIPQTVDQVIKEIREHNYTIGSPELVANGF